MPPPALLIALAGLVPFVGCGLMAMASSAANDPWLTALVGYAAVVLSFLGGVHWGLVLREPEPALPGPRLGMSIIPLLLGWAALAATAVVAFWLGLAILIVAYILVIAMEHQANGRGLLPGRYLWLRWVFTVVSIAMLTTVLTLRLLGQTIVF